MGPRPPKISMIVPELNFHEKFTNVLDELQKTVSQTTVGSASPTSTITTSTDTTMNISQTVGKINSRNIFKYLIAIMIVAAANAFILAASPNNEFARFIESTFLTEADGGLPAKGPLDVLAPPQDALYFFNISLDKINPSKFMPDLPNMDVSDLPNPMSGLLNFCGFLVHS